MPGCFVCVSTARLSFWVVEQPFSIAEHRDLLSNLGSYALIAWLSSLEVGHLWLLFWSLLMHFWLLLHWLSRGTEFYLVLGVLRYFPEYQFFLLDKLAWGLSYRIACVFEAASLVVLPIWSLALTVNIASVEHLSEILQVWHKIGPFAIIAVLDRITHILLETVMWARAR